MKRIIIFVVCLAVVMLGLPILIVYYSGGFYHPPTSDDDTVSVYIKAQDKVEEMKIGEYLKGVVAAEMPADFEEEALKAQAVAARSYLYARMENYKQNGAPQEHKGAYTCTDSTHCKAWISEQDRKAAWDEDKRDTNWEKICKAVDDTKGMIMTYQGAYVNAVFHSTSSGKTERSVDVWGGDVPYLQSVDSPGDAYSPKYHSAVSLTIDEFKKKAEEKIDGVHWDNGLIGDIQRSDAGGIVTITVGGVQVKGTQFRTAFDLRSTNVEIEVTDTAVNMNVTGYGHGVGMSQYGANYLAQQGKSYEEILKTYYTGVEIKTTDL